jgi:hypothetical protein
MFMPPIASHLLLGGLAHLEVAWFTAAITRSWSMPTSFGSTTVFSIESFTSSN